MQFTLELLAQIACSTPGICVGLGIVLTVASVKLGSIGC